METKQKKNTVAIIKKQANAMQKMVEETVVTNDAEYSALAEKTSNIKKLCKVIEKQKDEYVAPAKAIIAKAKVDYDPYIEQCKEAEKQLKNKGVAYFLEKEKKREAEEVRIAARVEKGTMKEETAVRKIEEMENVQKTVKSESGSTMTMKKVPKIVIIDEKALERRLLIPNEKLIKEEGLLRYKTGMEPLAGTKVEIEIQPCSR